MIFVVTGPPCSGKSTFVNSRAESSDVVVDFDRMAEALNSDCADRRVAKPKAVPMIARECWYAAVSTLMRTLVRSGNVYIVDSNPSDKMMSWYRENRCQIIDLDSDRDACLDRAKRFRTEREVAAVEDWDTLAAEKRWGA